MNALVLAKKDFASYFHSWMGILALSLFYLIAGIFFSLLVISYAKISVEAVKNAEQLTRGLGLTRYIVSSFLMNIGTVMMFFIPLITMRSLAEERKLKTLEIIFTYPLSDSDIVWGKFLGMVMFFTILSLPMGFYALIVQMFGAEFDILPVMIGFLGFFLLGIAYLSIGLFVSSLTDNQMTSAVVTFGLLVVFWILEWVAGIADGFWAHFLSTLSPLRHYQDFTLGVLDRSHLVYFGFFILYFLFLSLRSVERRKWKH